MVLVSSSSEPYENSAHFSPSLSGQGKALWLAVFFFLLGLHKDDLNFLFNFFFRSCIHLKSVMERIIKTLSLFDFSVCTSEL